MTPSASSPTSHTLVGRGREQQELRQILSRIQTGIGQFVLIGGEAGIGKTTLVQDLTQQAEAIGIPVFTGVCYDLETTPPYGPWLGAGILESPAADANAVTTPTLTPERKRLLDFLAEYGPSRPADVAGALGMSPNAATQALRRLLEENLVVQPAYGTYATIDQVVPADRSQFTVETDSLVRRLYNHQHEVAGGTQQALFRQILDLLAGRCKTRPTVLVLEDLHWSDQASIELLRYVVRTLDSFPLLLIATYRDVDLTPGQPLYRLLPQIVREGKAIRLVLSRFLIEDIRSLVQQRYQLQNIDEARLVRYLVEQTEGNPFFVEEVLRALEDEQRLLWTKDGWSLGDLANMSIPLLVRQLIDGRLDHLAPTTLDLLQLAAVIGAEFSLDLWQQISGVPDQTLLMAIEEAMEVQVLVEVGTPASMRFRHALIREALYAQVTLLRRRSWHRRIGEALTTLPDPDPDAVAYHFSEAHDPSRAADWLIRAGQRAAQAFAFQVTIQRYEQALSCLELDVDRVADRAWVLCDLAEAYRYTDASHALSYVESAYGLLNELNDPALETIVRWTHAHLRGFNGENALAELEDALARYQALSSEERARIEQSPLRIKTELGVHGQRLAHHGQYERAMTLIQEFLANHPSPLSPGHDTELAATLYGLGMAYSALGYPIKALDVLGQARTHAVRAGNGHLVGAILSWEHDHVYQIYFPENRSERLRLIGEADRAWQQSVYTIVSEAHQGLRLHHALLLEGRWDEVRASATAMLGAGSIRMKCLGIVAELDRLQGHSARAWGHISQALPAGPESPPGTIYFLETLHLQQIAAELAMDDGDLLAARHWIEALERWLNWSGIVIRRATPELLWTRFYELNGDLDSARQHAGRALALAQQPYQPLAVLNAYRELGHLDTLSGKYLDAATNLETATNLASQCQAPYEIAMSQLGWCELLIAQERLPEARSVLSEISQTGHDLGAALLLRAVERLQSELSSPGEDRDTHGGLSPRELDVLRLVAKGMTDSEIGDYLSISTRTVSGHLQSIYNKLGISSRTAATAFAYERQMI